jgi:3-methyladenine DNA glycosylase/8-oxoguanine DNA glycosylase
MSEQIIIDRETYRAIKKMSREELQAFLMRYANGLLESDGKSIDLREVEKDLRQIKGIGDKRIEEIMAVIEKHLGL